MHGNTKLKLFGRLTRSVWWVGYVARVGEIHARIWCVNLKKRDQLEEILQEYGERMWTGFSWRRIGTGVGVL